MATLLSQLGTLIKTKIDNDIAAINLAGYAELAGATFTGSVTVPDLTVSGTSGITLSDLSGGISLSGGSISLTSSGGVSLTDGNVYFSGSGSIDLSGGTGYIYAGDIDLSTRDGSITFGTMGGLSLQDGTISISGSGYIDVSGTSQSLFGDGGISVGSAGVTLSNSGGVDLSGGSGTLSMGTGAINLSGGGISDSNQISIGTNGINVSGSSVFDSSTEFQNGINLSGGYLTGTVQTDTDLTVGGNLVVNGDITQSSGSVFTVEATAVKVTDVMIEIAGGADGASNATTDGGIVVQRGSMEQNVAFYWDEDLDMFTFSKLDEDGSISDVSMGTNVAAANVLIAGENLYTEGSGSDAFGTIADFNAALNA